MKGNFCVNPWVSAHIKLDQGFNPCCLFSKTYTAESLDQYANGDELADLKARILSGERVQECNYCWMQEDQGYTSKRQRDNKTYEKVFLHRFAGKELVPQSNFNEYYVRLGNHCNLRCTTCSEEFSTGWISEYKKFGIERGRAVLLDDHDPLWQHLKDNARDIAVIQFIGGEPFMMSIELQKDLLQYYVETGHAKHIRLKYNTNLTRLPTEQLEYWPHFKAVEINASADGVDKRFEYLRFPAKWEEADKNLKFYKQLQSTTVPKLELTIMHTLSLFNIGYVSEILEYGEEQKVSVFLNLLEFPRYYNFFDAPVLVKEWIMERIQGIKNPVIQEIYNQLNKHQSTTKSGLLLDYIGVIDQRRNLQISATFPELFEVLISDRIKQANSN